MSKKKQVRRTNKTILVAVEGYTDEAFVRHLKELYCSRNIPISITIKNARGHGPEGVMDCIQSALKTAQYDLVAAVLDGDLDICKKCQDYFYQVDARLFISTPAIEATLLQIQNKKPGRTTGLCKRQLGDLLSGDSTEVRFYERHFPKEMIDKAKPTITLINDFVIFITS
jgi:hypothetical protein